MDRLSRFSLPRFCSLFAAGILIFCSLSPIAHALPEPAHEFYAADYAGLLSAERQKYYVAQGAALETATGAQIVVATVPSLEGQSVEEYANALFRAWGIGGRDKNNGLLILLALEERKIRVEVGYGLEGAINDSKATRYIDNYALDSLRENDFDEGIYQLYNPLLVEVYREYGLEPPADVPDVNLDPDDVGSAFSLIVVVIVIVVIISLFSSRGGRGRGTFVGPFFFGGPGNSGGGGIFGGGSSGGGFGGGGFSGGGGSSGGGGGSRGF